MRPARRDVLTKQLAVDIDGGVYICHDGVGLGTKAAAPHLVAHDAFVAVCVETAKIMTVHPEQTVSRLRRRIAIAAIAGFGALAAVYGVLAASRTVGEPLCRPALDLARRIEPLVHGEVAAVKLTDEARKLPELAFRDAAGLSKSLADWRGRTVLLNLWATWCVPCRKEMPALDALQDKLGGPNFEVVAINIPTRNPDKPTTALR